MKNDNHNLKTQTLSLFVGKVLAFLVQIITPLILVRILTKTDFGVYQQFQLLAGMLLPILGLCLNTSLFYYYPIYDQEGRKAIIIQTYCMLFLIGIIFVAVFLNFHGFILAKVNLLELDKYDYIISLYILFMLVSSITDFLFILEKKIKYNIFFYPTERLVRLVLILAFLYSNKNTWGCLMGLLVYAFIRFIFISLYIAKKYLSNIRHIWDKVRSGSVFDQLKYSLPFVGGVVLETISKRFDKILINKYVDPSEYAIYAVAFFSIPLLTMLFSSINNVVVPEMSRLAHAGSDSDVIEMWHKVVEKTSSAAIPCIVFFFIMAEEVIVILFTGQYAEAAVYYRIYLLTFIFTMTSFGLVLRSYKKTTLIFRANLISTITTVAIGYFLISNFQMIGAITTAVISIALPIIIVIYYEKKLLNLKIKNWLPWYTMAKITLIAILAGLIILPIKLFQFNDITALFITALLYFPIIIFAEYRFNLFIYPEVISTYVVKINMRLQRIFAK